MKCPHCQNPINAAAILGSQAKGKSKNFSESEIAKRRNAAASLNRKESPLTQDQLKELLSYDPETGHFCWKIPLRNAHEGKKAGWKTSAGYVGIQVDGHQYLAHRLVWLYIHGQWPLSIIDHINGDRGDNRLSNLREATASENQINRGIPAHNTSGYKGVVWRAKRNRWFVSIMANGETHWVGSFRGKEEAIKAYEEASKTKHGGFQR